MFFDPKSFWNDHQNNLVVFLIVFSGQTIQNNTYILFEEFANAFKESTEFKILDRIAPRGMINRLTVNSSSGIKCTLHIDDNADKIESSQVIRDCLLHSPICKHNFHLDFP